MGEDKLANTYLPQWASPQVSHKIDWKYTWLTRIPPPLSDRVDCRSKKVENDI